MAKRYYLAYGSNMNLEQMAFRCPTAKVVGSTNLKGYRMLFRGSRGCAVATIEKYAGGSVPVLIWDIKPLDEAALDRYEGWPRLYRKETVKVGLRGKQIEAMVYIMNEGRPLGIPGKHYYDTIAEGYCTAGFRPGILLEAVLSSAEDTAIKIPRCEA